MEISRLSIIYRPLRAEDLGRLTGAYSLIRRLEGQNSLDDARNPVRRKARDTAAATAPGHRPGRQPDIPPAGRRQGRLPRDGNGVMDERLDAEAAS